MSGLIGGAVLRQLGAAYAFGALNRRAVAGVPCHQADIVELEAIQPAFAGVDAVVHLAANASMSAPFEDTLRANVVGTYNVFEAARRAGVKRVVFASSGATVSGYEREMPYRALVTGCGDEVGQWPMISHESPLRPSGLYGASKAWGEALATKGDATTAAPSSSRTRTASTLFVVTAQTSGVCQGSGYQASGRGSQVAISEKGLFNCHGSCCRMAGSLSARSKPIA